MSEQVVALGIQARIEQLRGFIRRIAEMKRRYRELEANPVADPIQRENARVAWQAYEREFCWRHEEVGAILDFYASEITLPEPEPAPVVLKKPAGHARRTKPASMLGESKAV